MATKHSLQKEQTKQRATEKDRLKNELQNKSYRDHLCALAAHLGKHGRELTPEEEDELVRPPIIGPG